MDFLPSSRPSSASDKATTHLSIADQVVFDFAFPFKTLRR